LGAGAVGNGDCQRQRRLGEREMKEKGKKKEKAKMGRPNQYRDKGVSFSDTSFSVTRAPASVDMAPLGPAGSLRHHYP
jgi:hypothetical protein